MFGYVRPNLADMSQADQARYRAHYCGLCHAIGARHGSLARMALTFDLTYLTIFLASLYEPEETVGEKRCVVHPLKKRTFISSDLTEYAAAMNKDNTALYEAVNKALEELIADGTVASIVSKYIPAE